MAQRLYYRKFNTLDWEKDDGPTFEQSLHHAFRSKTCTNCKGNFSTYFKPLGHSKLYDNPRLVGTPVMKAESIWLFICYSCGWWQMTKKSYLDDLGHVHDPFIYHSVLERLDENSERAKIIELRHDLQKNWESRKSLSAGDAAELVRGIMKDHYKCDVVHTKANVNTPDGGIDLLIGHDAKKVLAAVQVKRRKNGDPEGISHVREFVGALAIQGHQKGIFVTTAERFTKAVHVEQKLLNERNQIELDLVNSGRLLELLNATTPYDSPILPLDLSESSYWQSGDQCFTTLDALMGNPGLKL